MLVGVASYRSFRIGELSERFVLAFVGAVKKVEEKVA